MFLGSSTRKTWLGGSVSPRMYASPQILWSGWLGACSWWADQMSRSNEQIKFLLLRNCWYVENTQFVSYQMMIFWDQMIFWDFFGIRVCGEDQLSSVKKLHLLRICIFLEQHDVLFLRDHHLEPYMSYGFRESTYIQCFGLWLAVNIQFVCRCICFFLHPRLSTSHRLNPIFWQGNVFFWGLFRGDRRKINTWLEATFDPQNIRPDGLWRGCCGDEAPGAPGRQQSGTVSWVLRG